MEAKFMCSGKQMTGEVVKSNFLTVLVRVGFKKKTAETIAGKIKEILKPYEKTIKRHKVKHNVVIMGE